MIYLFYFVAFSGISYFLIKQRRFDFLSLAYASSLLYFLPGFFGHVGFKKFDSMSNISSITYIVFIIVLISIIVTAILYDKKERQPFPSYFLPKESIYIGYSALFLGLLSLVFVLATTGNSLFVADKSVVLSSLNRWMILFHFFIPLATIIFFTQKKYYLLFFCFLFLIFDVLVGFRSSFALTLISILTIALNNKGSIRLIYYWKTLILSLAGVMFLLIIKMILYSIKSGDFSAIFDQKDLILSSIINAEPFGIQLILNEVIIKNFETSLSQFSSLFAIFIPLYSTIDSTIISFNDLFQPILFAEINYGMANNIWAQMWSSGGWLLLLLFLVFFNSILFLGSKLLLVNSSNLKALTALLFSYWAFYIHRNDIFYQLNLERRVLMVYMLSLILSILVYKLLPHKVKSRSQNHVQV